MGFYSAVTDSNKKRKNAAQSAFDARNAGNQTITGDALGLQVPPKPGQRPAPTVGGVQEAPPYFTGTVAEETPSELATNDNSVLVGEHSVADRNNDGDPDVDPNASGGTGEGGGDSYLTQEQQNFLNGGTEPSLTDTTDEEALVNQKILDQLGGDIVSQRARMGRAGFGASGALAALEGDTMRKANQDASSSIYDIREREQNQAQQFGAQDIGLSIQAQEAAAREAEALANHDLINSLLGGGTGAPATPSAAAGVPDDPAHPANTDPRLAAHGVGTKEEVAHMKQAAKPVPPGSVTVEEAMQPNSGLSRVYVDDTGSWFTTPSGAYWFIPDNNTQPKNANGQDVHTMRGDY